MSSYSRRNDANESYLMNSQIVSGVSYNHPEPHDFNSASAASYHFPQQSFSNPYGASQFGGGAGGGPTYGQQPTLTAQGMQHLQYASDHTIPSMSTNEDMKFHHPPSHAHAHSHSQYMAQSRYMQSPRYLPLREAFEAEIENQESRNEGTMLSEAVIPALNGFPDVKEFDQLMQSYVDDLSVKKQDKALIHAKRARNIRTVLIDPKDTAVESAQFRFWVKKMFKLTTVGVGTTECRKMICHEGKPVAIREKLFKILTKAHQQCQHGGRDKTSAQVRRIYSWVPKELISRFVKICPTCQVRRGGSRLTPPNSRRGSPRLEMMPRSSPKLPSPPISRRESNFGTQAGLDRAQSDYFAQQMHGHSGGGGWSMDQHQGLQGRGSAGGGGLHHRPYHGLPHSIAGTLDPFSPDMSVPPSQLTYGGGYVSAPHGTHDTKGFLN
ncbi:hypothetical protein N7481_000505 [Penicillium waksmanii]|uniref:uncharacterized protein n=1 Tax=Penicillium waksmanii TaxID=69791 RepID=UPI0025489767|nr:uncharacterized protein N7481_000505 [Penicillium waksmanii]KAJ6000096.1 hypothetical protein N7481_000505 [Penicillium waksmanii]